MLLLGATGAAAFLAGGPLALADDVTVKTLAPGVTLKTFKVVEPTGPIPGFSKFALMEIPFQPGSKLGPTKVNKVDL